MEYTHTHTHTHTHTLVLEEADVLFCGDTWTRWMNVFILSYVTNVLASLLCFTVRWLQEVVLKSDSFQYSLDKAHIIKCFNQVTSPLPTNYLPSPCRIFLIWINTAQLILSYLPLVMPANLCKSLVCSLSLFGLCKMRLAIRLRATSIHQIQENQLHGLQEEENVLTWKRVKSLLPW